ncbi:MAG: hypothetical protein J6S85_14365 [Methanobrevibacter sp.]|nr:hypothetical protein [Methanobrevibacter sp.]
MGYYVFYDYKGCLDDIHIDELEGKLAELQDDNDTMWNEILQYIAATPPITIPDDEGNSMSFIEYMSGHIKYLRNQIEENDRMITQINDCLETKREHPENVKEC